MLENFNPVTDAAKRQLYVAMTRAKQNLTIHLNGGYLDNITAENLERVEDSTTYLPVGELSMHLTHKDVWLDYFIRRQPLISHRTEWLCYTLSPPTIICNPYSFRRCFGFSSLTPLLQSRIKQPYKVNQAFFSLTSYFISSNRILIDVRINATTTPES